MSHVITSANTSTTDVGAFSVEPLTPHIGAEIFGVDLSAPLTAMQVEAIRAALLKHLVVFFRNQDITPSQLKEMAKNFGDLEIHPAAPKLSGHPEVLLIRADKDSTFIAGESWHSDMTPLEKPPLGSVLHLVELPESGGDTLFANMYAAYDTLSPGMQQMLSELTAVHDARVSWEWRYGENKGPFPRHEHPLVITHPETRRRALFVNSIFTTRIVGLSKLESDALLQFLFRHIDTPEIQCRFRWRRNSIAFWDNRSAQHRAIWDYYPQTRQGYRVTILGEKPSFSPNQ